MSGICSAHPWHEPDCDLCNTDIRELLPDYDAMIARSEAAGTHDCECGFTYYRVIDFCPLCSRPLPVAA